VKEEAEERGSWGVLLLTEEGVWGVEQRCCHWWYEWPGGRCCLLLPGCLTV